MGLEQRRVAGPVAHAVGHLGRGAPQEALDAVELRLVVDQHLLDVRVQEVADDAQRDVGLGVEEHRRLGQPAALLQRLPEALEEGEVAGDLAGRGPRGGRADDEAAALERQRVADRAQARALVVGQALGDAHTLPVGHEHHEAPGQRELHGEAHALGAHRVLRGLHHHLVAALEQLGDLALALGDPHRDDLVDVEEPVLLEADLDERGLHAREDVLHAALPHVAHDGAVAAALDVRLGRHPVLEDGHARLGAVDRHKDLLFQRNLPPG